MCVCVCVRVCVCVCVCVCVYLYNTVLSQIFQRESLGQISTVTLAEKVKSSKEYMERKNSRNRNETENKIFGECCKHGFFLVNTGDRFHQKAKETVRKAV